MFYGTMQWRGDGEQFRLVTDDRSDGMVTNQPTPTVTVRLVVS